MSKGQASLGTQEMPEIIGFALAPAPPEAAESAYPAAFACPLPSAARSL
jgi:hypothetical protein